MRSSAMEVAALSVATWAWGMPGELESEQSILLCPQSCCSITVRHPMLSKRRLFSRPQQWQVYPSCKGGLCCCVLTQHTINSDLFLESISLLPLEARWSKWSYKQKWSGEYRQSAYKRIYNYIFTFLYDSGPVAHPNPQNPQVFRLFLVQSALMQRQVTLTAVFVSAGILTPLWVRGLHGSVWCGKWDPCVNSELMTMKKDYFPPHF